MPSKKKGTIYCKHKRITVSRVRQWFLFLLEFTSPPVLIGPPTICGTNVQNRREKENALQNSIFLQKRVETVVDRELVRYTLALAYIYTEESSVYQLAAVSHVAFLFIANTLETLKLFPPFLRMTGTSKI